jgi:hypothetical protein
MKRLAKVGGVIDLSNFFGKGKNRIRRVGVEVEGAWNKPMSKIHRDGSVQVYETSSQKALHPYIGEIASEPIMPAAIPRWMRVHYPTLVNQTCGLHVHMSFGSKIHYYSQLMDPAYQNTMAHYLKEFGAKLSSKDQDLLIPRLAGKNECCTLNHWPDEQAKLDKRADRDYYDRKRFGNRYTGINYPWRVHGTMECRFLPMFPNVETGIKAAMFVIEITNAVLLAIGDRNPKVSETIVVDAKDIHREESIVQL